MYSTRATNETIINSNDYIMSDLVSKKLRLQIIDEMKRGRLDGKTYVDEEWLLDEYRRATLREVVEMLPEPLMPHFDLTVDYQKGYHTCLSTIRERLEAKK